jgi:hypothetical protein
MNKTEQRRLRTKTALNTLIEKFNAYSIDNEDGARFDFHVDYKDMTFHGQMDRRDLQVSLYDSIRLYGDGWSAEEILKQKLSVELEDIINEELEDVLDELDSKILNFEINEGLGFRPDALS